VTHPAKLLVTCLLVTTLNCAYAYAAGALVCYVEPKAGGSGVPDIKARLNGVKQPGLLRLRTFWVKMVAPPCATSCRRCMPPLLTPPPPPPAPPPPLRVCPTCDPPPPPSWTLACSVRLGLPFPWRPDSQSVKKAL